MRKSGSIKLAVTIFMAIAVTQFLPGLGFAGSLEPSGPPASTMKTLDQIPPTWDQKLPSDNSITPDGCNSSRFKCVLDGAGVLDKETGLVWEQSPTDVGDSTLWSSAVQGCVELVRGRRLGWRLPTVQELATLVDPTMMPSGGLLLPSGHPFSGVNIDKAYWSSSAILATDGSVSSNAWGVFMVGSIPFTSIPKAGAPASHVWCVRGGQQGVDTQ